MERTPSSVKNVPLGNDNDLEYFRGKLKDLTRALAAILKKDPSLMEPVTTNRFHMGILHNSELLEELREHDRAAWEKDPAYFYVLAEEIRNRHLLTEEVPKTGL